MTIIAKKITLGSINGVRAGFKNVTETTHIARIYGSASSYEAKDSTMGLSYKFGGNFIGVNQDGEETMAPVCYLIAPADGMLVEALKAANGGAVEFAFDFFVVPNASAVLGYEYKIKPVIEVKKSEPLLALASKFSTPGPVKKADGQLKLEGNGTAVENAAAGAETVAAETVETAAAETATESHSKGKNRK